MAHMTASDGGPSTRNSPAGPGRTAAASGRADPDTVAPQDVRKILWRGLLTAAAVSGGINLLQLAPALYMYQVYDRVLATQHVETLVALTIIAVMALILLAALDGARNAVGQRLGGWVEKSLAGPLLYATVHGAPLVGTARGA